MKKKLTLAIASIATFLAMTANSFAAVAEPEPAAAPPARCELTFATGPAGKGYSTIFKNIKDICLDVPVCEKTSEGGLDNGGLLIEKKSDVGLMGINTLRFLLDKDDQYKTLQVVASMHSNLLHVVTMINGFDIPSGQMVPGPMVKNPNYAWYKPGSSETIPGPMIQSPAVHIDITKYSDLKGKAVGVVGSAQLLGRQLDKQSGHGMIFIDYSNDAEALAALKANKVVGVMTMAAWPHGIIGKMKSDSGIKLVPYDLTPVAPFTVVKKGYKLLGQYSLEFLAEPNILVTRAFATGGANAKNVTALRSCITKNLPILKEGSAYEPGWSEISDLNQTYNFPGFGGGPAGAKPAKK